MTLPIDEPEILDGTRSWNYSQTAFLGVPDPVRKRYVINTAWYDTTVSEWAPAFCLVQTGSELEELIGEIVQVEHGAKKIYLYCVGGADLPEPIALCRYAFFQLGQLSDEVLPVVVRPVVPK